METKHLALIMMIAFFVIVIAVRVGVQIKSAGDSGIRSGTKLKSSKERIISYLTFGTLLIQTALTWLYSRDFIVQHIVFNNINLWVGSLLCIIGISVASYSQFAMGTNWRIGVDPDEVTDLVKSGIYSKIRNPIYTGCILHGVGILLLAPNFMVLVTGTIGYIAIRAYVSQIEEPYLIKLHGQDYLDYMDRTNSFFPKLRNTV